MTLLQWYLAADIFLALWFTPVLILWCFIPGKSIREGLQDWMNEEV